MDFVAKSCGSPRYHFYYHYAIFHVVVLVVFVFVVVFSNHLCLVFKVSPRFIFLKVLYPIVKQNPPKSNLYHFLSLIFFIAFTEKMVKQDKKK